MSRPLTSIEPYGSGNGIIIRAQTVLSPDTLDKDVLLKQLSETGFILFRGFDVNLDGFSRLVQKLSTRVTLDPARTFHGQGDVAQKVDAGVDPVGLHCENGNSPFMPHLCWFYCQQAAAHGSQTTVCDGYRAWDALSESTQQTFLAQDIVYTRHVEEDKWKRFVARMQHDSKPLDTITIDDLRQLANDPVNTTITQSEDGAIRYAFRVAAVHPTLFGSRLAFAHSILGPSYNYEKPVITFADGTPLSPALLREIDDACEQVTENIEWQQGDIVLIDNTRVMHGRRAIQDPERTIFNALSYIH
ncbi:TauD/TfdA family dioxygenase [Burkholderiaceae bacterium DAT-1]|nr:TauD/TfdA family dioxygenase [Burkholderiaceae bacterium DAT-1]